ncbi:MAG: ABC transporter permease [Acetatifactor sp.]|nr:ABC transporter permease [Acetatifactor sp.]
MVRFEIKKIFSKTVNKIALIILAVVVCVESHLAISSVLYVDENGDTITGIFAAQPLREAKMQWSGYITEDILSKVVEENALINNSEEYLSNDVKENNKAFSKKQGFSDIRNIINRAFCGFRQYDYYRIDSISGDEVRSFYERRISNLIEWINSDEATNHFSDKEKLFLTGQYNKLETPLYYEYFGGWDALLEKASAIIMLLVLITGFLVSGIFSDEIQLKADSIFFSTRLGRTKAVSAKIGAGFIIISSIYWITILLYSGIVLTVLGFEGADCAIQIGSSNWKSFYNITYFQDYLLTVFGGYIGSLFILTLSMFVSAKTRSSVLAVTIPFILIFIPSFLSGISALSEVLGLLPDQLLQMCKSVQLFNTYQIGNKVVGAVPIILVAYLILYCILVPVLYRVYKKTEVK